MKLDKRWKRVYFCNVIFLGILSLVNNVNSSCSKSGNTFYCYPGITIFPLYVPQETKSLYVSGTVSMKNHIPRLTQALFMELSKLTHLTLSDSEIGFIEDGAFSYTRLHYLDLSHNSLTELTVNTLQGLENLVSLDLTNNFGLQIHPRGLRHVPKLKALYISQLNLTSIANIGLHYISKLETLDVHSNNLKRIDMSVILYMTSLRNLDISGNQVSSMSNDTLSKLVNLQYIQVDNNPWDCNCEIFWMKKLPNNAGERIICKTPRNIEHLTAIELNPSSLRCIPTRITGANCKIAYQQDFHTTLNTSCVIQGNPYPEVTWIRPDGAKIEYFNYQFPRYSVSDTGMITISQLDRVDNGKWKMVIRNILKELSVPVTVTVTNIPIRTQATTLSPSSTKNTTQPTSAKTAKVLPTATKIGSSTNRTTSVLSTTINTPSPPTNPGIKEFATSTTERTDLSTAKLKSTVTGDRSTPRKGISSTLTTEEQGAEPMKSGGNNTMQVIYYIIATLVGTLLLTSISIISVIWFCLKTYKNKQLREIFWLKPLENDGYEIPDNSSTPNVYLNDTI